MYRLSTAAQGRGAGVLLYVAYALQTWLAGSGLYLLALLLAGRRETPGAPAGGPHAGVRVAVLMPAHDEEAAISAAVAALRAQDHPTQLLDLIVIADNCTDRTAALAAAAGATVWDRRAPDAPGKPQALSWAIERLWRELPETEAVVIVDADCAASPNLCSIIAGEIARGAEAVQVPYEVSNPSESPTAALRAAGFSLKHVIRARGRARLGLSCNLFGTGMGFSAPLLRRVPWPQSVTEDTELFVRLTRGGHRVAFAGGARVTSPMPASAEQASQQQLRWESGNAQLARRELPGLVGQAVGTADLQCLGAAAELALPSQTLMAAGGLALLAVGAACGDRRLVVGAIATIAAQGSYVVGGLAAAGGSGLVLNALVHVPSFAAGRLRVLSRVASGRGARSWVRTTR
jgi:cellulose synthase/poly-beta-1,6-N-acetylglucosamine synthase-like glycosyltransferase